MSTVLIVALGLHTVLIATEEMALVAIIVKAVVVIRGDTVSLERSGSAEPLIQSNINHAKMSRKHDYMSAASKQGSGSAMCAAD